MPSRGSFIAAALCAALILPASASASTIWTVDPGAAAGCNAARVCKTISDANASLAAGDLVSIKPGNYTERDSVTVTKSDVEFKATPGTVSVTTVSSPKGKPVFVLGAGTKLNGLSIGAPQNGGQAVLVKGANTTVTTCFLARLLSNDQNAPVYQVDPSVASGTSTLSSSFVLQAPTASPNEIAPAAIVGNGSSSLAMTDDNVFAGPKNGPALVLSGNAAGTPNSIVRSSLFAQGTASNAITFTSAAGSGAEKSLTLDSVLLSGGSGASGITAAAAAGSVLSSAAGGITVSGVHVTIAGVAHPVSMSSGSDVLAGPSGTIDVSLDRSIVHGSSASATGDRTKLTLTTSDVTDAASPTIVLSGTQASSDAALFAAPSARNFHLRTDAPAIDKAGDLTAGGSDRDIDLEPRLTGAATDMGADEFVNKPPKAALKAPSTAVQNQPVTFDGSGSSDPEASYGGGIKTYRWDFGDGQTTETTTPTVQHAYPDIGSYDIKLTVVDSFGVTSGAAGATVQVTDGIPPVVKLATPRKGQRFHVFSTVTTKKTIKNADGTTRVVTTKRKVRRQLGVTGTTTDEHGVKTVELSLRRVSRTRGSRAKKAAKARSCVYFDGKRGFTTRNCKKPVYFFVALKNGVFRFRTKRGTVIRPGVYDVSVRATDGSGVTSAPVTVRIRFVP